MYSNVNHICTVRLQIDLAFVVFIYNYNFKIGIYFYFSIPVFTIFKSN